MKMVSMLWTNGRTKVSIVVNVHLFYQYGGSKPSLKMRPFVWMLYMHARVFCASIWCAISLNQTNEQDFQHTSGILAKWWMFKITIESIIIVAVHFAIIVRLSFSMIQYSTVQHCTVRYGVVRYGTFISVLLLPLLLLTFLSRPQHTQKSPSET